MEKTRVSVVFHSMWGHVFRLAEGVADGAREVPGVEVEMYRVKETLPREVLEKMGAIEPTKAFAHLPEATPDALERSHGILLGTATRFGNMTAQMRALWDATGGLWSRNALAGKVASVFTSSNTQHGGQEATILSFLPTLIHHGMIIVSPGYVHQAASEFGGISGGGPYGASTLSGPDGSRFPSGPELALARFQGRLVAETARKLFQPA